MNTATAGSVSPRRIAASKRSAAPHDKRTKKAMIIGRNQTIQPEVTVEAGGEKFKARARVIDGEDYERLYKQHADQNPQFWEYRQKTSRKIPVVLLERLEDDKQA